VQPSVELIPAVTGERDVERLDLPETVVDGLETGVQPDLVGRGEGASPKLIQVVWFGDVRTVGEQLRAVQIGERHSRILLLRARWLVGWSRTLAAAATLRPAPRAPST
jgi:hypothetical protein